MSEAVCHFLDVRFECAGLVSEPSPERVIGDCVIKLVQFQWQQSSKGLNHLLPRQLAITVDVSHLEPATKILDRIGNLNNTSGRLASDYI